MAEQEPRRTGPLAWVTEKWRMSKKQDRKACLLLAIFVLFLSGGVFCAIMGLRSSQDRRSTGTPRPTATASPTRTPTLTRTIRPTRTTRPTQTPRPTHTPRPTQTARPTQTPTSTRTPTRTATPRPTSTPTLPRPTNTPVPPPAVSRCDPGQVDINSAPKEELKRIIHIDEQRADELIRLRPFRSVDSLDRITGIGPTRLREIKEQGIACVP